MYQASPGYISRTIAGETVLIALNDPHAGNNLMLLNETGAFLWEQLREPRSMDALLRAAQQTFDAPENVIRAETIDFIESLVKLRLIIERSYDDEESMEEASADRRKI